MLNNQATEVLELCLSNESPEIRSRVYEIINLSGLDSNDPMFLILALTGQIRVFLEAAPAELRELLQEWKEQNSESLSQIESAISLVIESHQDAAQDTAEIIKQNLEDVSSKCVANIKQAGMATTSAIAQANNETLSQARQAKDESQELINQVKSLHALFKADRKTSQESMVDLIKKFQQTTDDLNTANTNLKNVILSAKNFHQQVSWAKRWEWFSPLLALLLVGFSGGVLGSWLTSRFYSSPAQVLGRKISDWNQEELYRCIDQNLSTCTIKILPPK